MSLGQRPQASVVVGTEGRQQPQTKAWKGTQPPYL